MENPPPTVSVVIPAYNAENTIERAVQSVLRQSLRPNQIIIVNDGSDDATESILRGYGERVTLINQENTGASAARNMGILASTSTYVAFLDADDCWSPEKLEKQLLLFKKNPEIGFVSCHANIVNTHGELNNIWKDEESELELLPKLFTQHAGIPGSLSAVVIRHSLFAKVGLFDTSLGAQEDIDMWIRLASKTGYACLQEPLATIHKQKKSVSTNFDTMLTCAKTVMKSNRYLLPKTYRSAFWRQAYSGMLSDYAKWALRNRDYSSLCRILLSAALTSTAHWRLLLSIAYSAIFRLKI